MKRPGEIGASQWRHHLGILVVILASSVLVLIALLPTSVPFLAQLLRPSPYCPHGSHCLGDATRSLILQLRAPFGVFSAIVSLCTAIFVLWTRVRGEAALGQRHNRTVAKCSNDADSASGMSAKEIATLLPGLWTTEASGYAYSNPQRRVRIAVETNDDWDALRYERRDPNEDSEEFAHDLLAIIGDDLCARDQIALIRALVERLTAWQVRRGCEDDPVRHCLEELLNRHRQTKRAVRTLSEVHSEEESQRISE